MAIEIKLTKRVTAIVGNRDSDLRNLKWFYTANRKNPKGYAGRAENGRIIFLHKVIALRMGLRGEIDHKDTNRLNNRRSNLRRATHSQNCSNKDKQINNTSGYKGVVYVKRKYSPYEWKAKIGIRGRRINLGYYTTPQDAARAYDKAAIKYFGRFARTNH